jgi:hypothetical protein
MATPAPRNAGFAATAREIGERASSIARLELRLAAAELKEKVAALGLGIGLGLGAAICMLFALGFVGAAVAAAIATAIPTWAALLAVGVGFAALAAILGGVAIGAVKRGTPPVPRQAIAEARLTAEAVKGNGSHGRP